MCYFVTYSCNRIRFNFFIDNSFIYLALSTSQLCRKFVHILLHDTLHERLYSKRHNRGTLMLSEICFMYREFKVVTNVFYNSPQTEVYSIYKNTNLSMFCLCAGIHLNILILFSSALLPFWAQWFSFFIFVLWTSSLSNKLNKAFEQEFIYTVCLCACVCACAYPTALLSRKRA